MKPIDLRSDTVTRPTPAMWEAMRAAPLGAVVFGDDPTVNALQERIAADLGFEAALVMPSGTRSNPCALMSHCQRGDEVIVGQMAHTCRWEGGGAAVLGSIQPQPLPDQGHGTLALSDIEAAAAVHRGRDRSGPAQGAGAPPRRRTPVQLPGVSVATPQSKIVFVDLAPGKPGDAVARLRERGALATGLYRLRLLTHLGVSSADIERALPVLREVLG
jgi:threonine aldolase